MPQGYPKTRKLGQTLTPLWYGKSSSFTIQIAPFPFFLCFPPDGIVQCVSRGGACIKQLQFSLFFFFLSGTIFVDPSPYTINLLIAYDENTFFLSLQRFCVLDWVPLLSLVVFLFLFATLRGFDNPAECQCLASQRRFCTINFTLFFILIQMCFTRRTQFPAFLPPPFFSSTFFSHTLYVRKSVRNVNFKIKCVCVFPPSVGSG